MSAQTTIVGKDGVSAMVPSDRVHQVRDGLPNVLAETHAGIMALVATMPLPEGQVWAVWSTGAGYAACAARFAL